MRFETDERVDGLAPTENVMASNDANAELERLRLLQSCLDPKTTGRLEQIQTTRPGRPATTRSRRRSNNRIPKRYRHPAQPDRRAASAASSVRLLTPSLRKTEATWLLTVSRVTKSRSAI